MSGDRVIRLATAAVDGLILAASLVLLHEARNGWYSAVTWSMSSARIDMRIPSR